MHLIKPSHKESLIPSFNPYLQGLILIILINILSVFAWARPSTRLVSQSEDDATVSLTLESQFINEDSNIPCEVSISILAEDVAFTEGDLITVSVKEDDLFGDDVFWSVEEIVDAQTVASGIFERTYDCRFGSMGDAVGTLLEVYARVEVEKAECGRLCLQDNPATANIIMRRMNDDLFEDDDSNRDGTIVEERLISDRISIDADWYQLNYSYPVELLARLESWFIGGDLTLKLYDQNLNLLSTAVIEASGDSKSLRPASALSAGTYFLEVVPSVAGDFNFYDLYVVESQVMGNCIAGDLETRPCGLCGQEERVCNEGGEWAEWSMCMDSGVCEPGAEESEGCGDNGSRQRVCGNDCQWQDYSECIQCEDGTTETCYTGPAELVGIGACTEGMRSCSRGQWSSCQDDVLPRSEVCDDGIDNDCNGQVDANDEACAAGIGEACMGDRCGEGMSCLDFPGGYCGVQGCLSCVAGSVCGEVAGRDYCLASCDSASDCRSGYLCAPAGRNGESLCIPPCSGNQDCGVGQVCGSQRYCESAAGLGAACTQSDDCASPYTCLTGAFPGGYCGAMGCAQCGIGGICGQVRGQEYCLEECNAADDCRSGYICAAQGDSGRFACVPPCTNDSECSVGEICGAQGVCIIDVPSAGQCGMNGTCATGQVCGVDSVSNELQCMPSCTSDEACGEGKVCGVEGFCVVASGVDIVPTTASTGESSCQQGGLPTFSWLWLALMILVWRRQESHP